MKRSLALVSVVGLFLLGTVVGALGMHLYDARHPFSGPSRDGAPSISMGIFSGGMFMLSRRCSRMKRLAWWKRNRSTSSQFKAHASSSV